MARSRRQLFKEFSLEGKRIETRIFRRVNDDDSGWVAMTYGWNAAQTDAVAVPDGVAGALGTEYDIPSTRTCMACHGGRPEHVLGFGAIQLSHAAKEPDEITLVRLADEGVLSVRPPHGIAVPGAPSDVAAIGYLHANLRCMTREGSQWRRMPPVGTKVLDSEGLTLVHGWLERTGKR